MRNILIIYPHWPPSNLAGVHRPRLISNFLPDFNWHPIILTVHPDYYEERPDPDLLQTVNPRTKVVHAKAYNTTRPRLIGDIGLRAFPFLYKKATSIIRERKIDFIWIPIPSFYTSIIGRILYHKTKVPYGIDYIDPWVRDISTRKDLRHQISNLLARILEPIAIKKASLITGVSEQYYIPALQRNFKQLGNDKVIANRLNSSSGLQENDSVEAISTNPSQSSVAKSQQLPLHLAFPYGFDPHDHQIEIPGLQYPWQNIPDCKPWVYAGAFLPKSRLFVQTLFQAIQDLVKAENWNQNTHLFFLGTGNYAGETIKEIAQKYEIDNFIRETRQRFPFLHILNFLKKADKVMIIGSTEKHYTASKTFQSLLSQRPVFSIFHAQSDAVKVMAECNADQFLVKYQEQDDHHSLKSKIQNKLQQLLNNPDWHPNLEPLNKYSAQANAQKLVTAIERII